MANKTLIAVSCILLLMSCGSKRDKECFKWGAAVCQPANYTFGDPKVFFYSEGLLVLNTGSPLYSSSWGHPDDIHNSDVKIPLPDSVFVSYESINDKNETWNYQGGAKLSKETFLKLFNQGYQEDGKRYYPQHITAGMAPGGRVCIWVNPVEILRFTVPAIEKIDNRPLYLDNKEEYLEYLKHHPIDYTYWEKPDERYDLDFGFTSEDGNSECYHCFFYTKEGVGCAHLKDDVEKTKWNTPYGQPADKDYNRGYVQFGEIFDTKYNMPVHVVISWNNTKTGELYSTDVVMPKGLEERFARSYSDPETGGPANFTRIVFGVEKDGKHAVLWLDGPGKQEKIMRFKACKGIMKEIGLYSGGYAKDVVYY